MALRFEVDEGIATITLSRPEALNAIDPPTRLELRQAWADVRARDDIRVVILTGQGGKSFCTGSDLKKTMPPKESFAELSFGRSESDHILAGMDIAQPIICAINGYAMGGGLELALACDIRIASRTASFALSEVRIGSIPGGGGTQRLPRAVGLSSAMLLLLTGDRIDADEALRIGLVSKLADPEDLMDQARAIARRIADNAPLAVRAVKRLVRDGLDMPLEGAIQMERCTFGLLRDTEDRIEGRMAFQEKRAPVYRGR
ncbi:enoyl-CoA hydratase/isomerase family protein [Bordetella petrii]|uniref:enoyl-CoA hydratase/isomerase family protein n=1 Tax=Bordetella petrii TaxID=94624 RepID=UPI001E437180|nr:enoyl-CoA hydratase-related protein [Bordetella petrii]MCD0502652.1 enoyl-CoA hydratase-related protein [Bordetella petrii]